ncbi:hypothetical protein AM629_16485 [Photorhabdus heterorhabditis]|uniref:Uncharacterized protein n=1 Tax=Photorhabdus heterorhabditis TaxID=880156 RepID=A0ABR5K8K9_9GAMM|nr:hypothetical protein [Photorhabdus heterorhabditis]KOY60949.1 hypothetical protein AM629_16485 [Photorhabdus heterorhabditis]
MSNDAETMRDFLVSLKFDVDEVGQRKFIAVITEVTANVLKMRAEIKDATSEVVNFITQVTDGLDKLYGQLQKTGSTIEKIKPIDEGASQAVGSGSVEGFLPKIDILSHANGGHVNTASLITSMSEPLLKATMGCADQNTNTLDSDDIFNAIEGLVKWLNKGEASANGLLKTLNELWKFTGRKMTLGILFNLNSRLNALQEEARKNHETVGETIQRQRKEREANKKPLLTFDQLNSWISTHGLYVASDLTPFFSKDNYEKYQKQLDGSKPIIDKDHNQKVAGIPKYQKQLDGGELIIDKDHSQKIADIPRKVSGQSSKAKKKRKNKPLNKDHHKAGIAKQPDTHQSLNAVNQSMDILNSELTETRIKKLMSSRGARNNNPLNMNFANQRGAVREDSPGHRFAKFPDAYSGLKATAHQLRRYFSGKTTGKKLQTIASIIPTWAPSKDGNKTKAYIASVSKMMGVSKDAFLDLTDPNVMQHLIDSMMVVEIGGNPYSPEFIRAAILGVPPSENKPLGLTKHLNNVANYWKNISIDPHMLSGAMTNINSMINHQGVTHNFMLRSLIPAGNNNMNGIGEVNYHIEINGVESPREAARLTGETVERTHSMLLRNMQTQVR